MKTISIFIVLILSSISIFAQSNAKLYTPGQSLFGNTSGYGIGIDIDEPDARLHLNDQSVDGIALRLDMQYSLVPSSSGNVYGQSLYAIEANRVDETGTRVETVFTVDRSGKISSGLSSTRNDDQVSVQGPLSVYQSQNYRIKLSASTGLQPTLT